MRARLGVLAVPAGGLRSIPCSPGRRVESTAVVTDLGVGAHSAIAAADGASDRCAGSRRGNGVIPCSFDLAHEGGIHDPIPERLDERHVALPEWTARLHVHRHLSVVAASP